MVLKFVKLIQFLGVLPWGLTRVALEHKTKVALGREAAFKGNSGECKVCGGKKCDGFLNALFFHIAVQGRAYGFFKTVVKIN